MDLLPRFSADDTEGVPDLRASDADREAAVESLRHHALAGRLTVEELDERVEKAYTAKMLSELAALLADLPRLAVRPRRPAAPPSRRPRVPGRWAFTNRWHSPADAQITMRELMTFVVPPMVRWGYDLTQRFDGRLRFERETRPAWTILVAIFAFPFGLFALLYKDRERVTIDLDEDEHGTHVVASGIAPLQVRRAFAELED
jgi:Domain of unknown function (DUF1707)